MSNVSSFVRQTGVDRARDAVRSMILRGEMAQGSRVTLPDVARRIGTSVTPVREALRDLAATGLVDIDPHKGARVHVPTAAELSETYTLRSMLESRAMAEVAELPEEDRVVACTLAARSAGQMDSESDVATWVMLNRDFHGHLAEPLRTTWPVLFSLVDSLRSRSLLSAATALRAHPGLLPRANRRHRDLVEAIRKGNSARAAQLTAEHLDRTLQILLKSFAQTD